MATSLDNKVVTLRLDSSQFESSAQRSEAAAKGLSKALQMDGATEGLNNVEHAAASIDLSNLESQPTKAQLAFQALAVAAGNVLGNIATKAVSAGAALVKNLTIGPVLDGFREYELKMKSIQTILSNTAAQGTKLEDVNRVLDDMNHYADLTVYSFSDMTQAVGQFTAAGVPLEKSVSAIKGISNLAATVGADSASTSRVMFQLSQALSTGTVRLQDWISVENTAGMGGKIFQDALIQTAKRHGIAVDEMIAKQGSFRASLQEGWLSADILNETLNNFTVDGAKSFTKAQVAAGKMTEQEAQAMIAQAQMMQDNATKVRSFSQLVGTVQEELGSGWANTWEAIIGTFSESTELFTKLGDEITGFFQSIAEARNKALDDAESGTGWKQLGGRTILLEGLKNAAEALIRPLVAIGKAFREVFPVKTGQQLLEATKRFRDFTAVLAPTDTELKMLQNTFRAFFSVLQLVLSIIKSVVIIIAPLFRSIQLIGDSILSLLGISANFVPTMTGASNAIESFAWWVNKLENAGFDWIRDHLLAVTNAINSFAKAIADTFGKAIQNGIKAIETFADGIAKTEKVSNSYQKLSKAWSDFAKVIDSIFKTIEGGFERLAKAISKASPKKVDELGKSIQSLGFQKAVIDIVSKAFNFLADAISSASGKCKDIQKWLGGWKSNIGTVSYSTEEAGNKAKDTSKYVDVLGGSYKNVMSPAAMATDSTHRLSYELKTLGDYASGAETPLKSAKTAIEYFSKSVGEKLGILDSKTGTFSDGLGKKLEELAWSSKKHALSFGASMNYARENGVQALIDLDRQYSAHQGKTNKFAEFMSKAISTIGQAFGKLKDAVGSAFDYIKKHSSEIEKTIGKLLNLFIAGKIEKSTKNIKKSAEAIAEIPKAIMAPFAGVKKSWADNLKTMANAIVELAGAMLILSMINPVKLAKGIAAFSAIIGEAIGVFKTLAKISKSLNKDQAYNFQKLSKSLTDVGLAMDELAVALKIISRVKPEDLTRSMVALSVLLGDVLGFLIAIDKTVGSKDVGNYTKGLLKVSTAILIMSIAMNILGQVGSGKDGIRKAGVAAGLMGEAFMLIWATVAIFVQLDSKYGGKKLDKIAKTTTTLSKAFLIMSTALLVVSKIPSNKFPAVAAIFAEMAGILVAISFSIAKMTTIKDLDTKKFSKMAGALVLVSGSMYILASAFKLIGSVNKDNYAGASMIFAEMAIAIGSFMLIADKLDGKPTKILAMVPALVAMGTTMVLLAAAFKMVSTIDENAVVTSSVMFGEMAVAIDAFMLIVGHIGNKGGAATILASTPAILAMGVCMTLLASAFKIVATIKKESVVTSSIIFGEMAASIDVMFAVLSKFGKGGFVTLLAASVTLVALAKVIKQMGVSFAIVAAAATFLPGAKKALYMFGSLFGEIDVLFAMLTAFEGKGGILVAAALTLTAFGFVLMQFGSAMLKISMALSNASGANKAIAMMLVVLGSMLGLFVILSFFKGKEKILVAASLVVAAFALVIGQFGSAFVAIANSMKKSSGANRAMALMIILCGAMVGLFVVLGVLANNAPVLAGAAAVLVGVALVFNQFAQMMQVLANLGKGSTRAMIILGMLIAVLAIIAVIVSMLGGMLGGIVAGGAAAAGLAGIFAALTGAFASLSGDILGKIGSLFNSIFSVVKGLFATLVSVLGSLISNVGSAVGGFFSGIFSTIGGFFMNIFSTVGGFFSNIFNTVVGFFSNIFGSAGGFFSNVIGSIGGFFSNLFGSVGGFFSSLFGSIGGFFSNIIGNVVGFLGNLVQNFANGAGNAIRGFVGKLSPNTISSAVSRLVSVAGSKIREVIGHFGSAGWDAVKGFANGIRNGIGTALNAVKSLCNDVKSHFKHLLQLGSPSKMTRQFGLWTDEGYGIGVTRGTKDVVRRVGEFANAAIIKLQDTLSKSVESTVDVSPVIAPVMDLSNIKEGAATMQSMLNDAGSSVGINGLDSNGLGIQNGNNGASDSIDRLTKAVKQAIEDSDTPVINVYGANGQDVNSLADKVADRIIEVSYRRASMV